MARPRVRREIYEKRLNIALKPSFREKLDRYVIRTGVGISDILRDGAEIIMQNRLPVLGNISCGPIEEAIEQSDVFQIAPPHLGAQPGDYFLESSGSSMEPTIYSRDLVLLRPGIDVSTGEIVAVQIFRDSSMSDCDSTLKRFYHQPGSDTVTLKADNPAFDPIEAPAALVRVVGVFRGLVRRDN
jgi:SOS-response transcriptional repressor LexA